MICDAPFPSVRILAGAAGRFDLALVALDELGTGSAKLFGADFGAVVFAITLFLYASIY
jgi:hypothetical protein